MSFFLPFFPLERRHIRQLFDGHLRERGAELARRRLGALQWDDAVLDFLTSRVRWQGAGGGCATGGAAERCAAGETRRVPPFKPPPPSARCLPRPLQVDFDGDFPIEGAKEVATLLTRYVSRPLRLWTAAQQQQVEQQQRGKGGGSAVAAGRLHVASSGIELAIEPSRALT